MVRIPDPVIHYESPEAAKLTTVTGWVCRLGCFHGDNEHMARWSGCTHLKCSTCGQLQARSGYCSPCYEKGRREKFLSFPEVPWDGSCAIALFDDDRFFFDAEDLANYCEDNDCKPTDLPLVICEQQRLREVDADYWSDELAEDGELPDDVQAAVDALNQVLAATTHLLWHPTDVRAKVDNNIIEDDGDA